MTAAVAPDVIAAMPRKLAFLRKPARYKVAYGGRGGGKSWAFARQLLIRGVQEPIRVLCTRELQVSIADSVHKLLSDQIAALGLGGWYAIQQQTIRGRNGSEFIFSGLRSNVTKIKSMEGVDVVWVEEAETVSEESWRILIPTIRKKGSEIWVSFNPREESDPTYRRFVVNPPPDAVVVKIGWQDNPWFPAELRREKEYDYSVDPDAAAHVWGGECRSQSDAQVLKGKVVVESFDPRPEWSGPYYGADWGFAKDPTTLVRAYVDEETRTLYVDAEAYGVGVDIDATPALFDGVPGARDHAMRADSARPETISYMKRNGYPRIVGVEKWQGSLEDGIAFLRSFARIVVHPRCRHVAEEARLYSYRVDRLTGDVLPIVEDAHNHTMDALRYALQPLIRRAGGGWGRFLSKRAAGAEAGVKEAAGA